MVKIKINTNNTYYVNPILHALQKVQKQLSFEVSYTDKIPSGAIEVDGVLVAFIAYRDWYNLLTDEIKILKDNNFKIIFKYHYSPKIFDYSIYGDYEKRIVPCGLYRWWRTTGKNLLDRPRALDINARMRCTNKGSNTAPWVAARRMLVKVAKEMGQQGYKTGVGKIDRKLYEKELLNTKIGVNWSASAYLGWKIPEFIQQGVVMITQPLGKRYPLCNDVILEDNVHCVFCDDPSHFRFIAAELLADKDRLRNLRKNVIDLWNEKLAPEKVGAWYYHQIMGALNG